MKVPKILTMRLRMSSAISVAGLCTHLDISVAFRALAASLVLSLYTALESSWCS